MIDSIKDKIRKLLAMGAKDSGATEDEAETAMKIAASLMAKHGIEASTLGAQAEANKARWGTRIDKMMKTHQIMLASAAGVLYGCGFVTHDRGATGLTFIGRPDNIDAAEETLMWLMRQVEDFYKAALPSGLSQAARAEFRATFKQACAARVCNRAVKLIKDMSSGDQAAQATGSNALVVKGYFESLKAENQLVVKESQNVKPGRPMRLRHGNGSNAGYQAGDRVQLRRQVG